MVLFVTTESPSPIYRAEYRTGPGWPVALALLGTMFLLFYNSQPVSNYFDFIPYFVFYLILPALATVLACVALQRLVPVRLLRRGVTLVEVVLLGVFAAVSLAFEAYNADPLMYVSAALMVYNPCLYCAVLAGAAALFYCHWISVQAQFHAETWTPPAVSAWTSKNMAFAALVTLGAVLVADFSHGLCFLFFAGIVGAGAVLHPPLQLTTRVTWNANTSSRGPRTPSWRRSPSPAAKNVLLGLALLVGALLVGFLWPISFVRYAEYAGESGATMYYELDKRQVIPDVVTGLVVFLIAWGILAPLVRRAGERFARGQNPERAWAAVTLVLGLGTWGLMNTGVAPLPVPVVRWISITLPWILLAGAQWVHHLVMQRRPARAPGLLGAILVLVALGGWGGICLGAEPDPDYAGWLLTSLGVVVLGLVMLAYGVVEPRAARNRVTVATPAASPAPSTVHLQSLSRASRASRDQSRLAPPDPGRRVRATFLRAVGLTGLVLIPLFALPGAVQASHASFQVLANVENQCLFFLADSTTRVDHEYLPGFSACAHARPDPHFALSAARGEAESVQVVMRPVHQVHFSIYDVSFSGFTHLAANATIAPDACQVYRATYVEALGEIIPDRLVPFAPFAVADGRNHPLWFTFTIPRDAVAGEYRGTVTLEVDDKTNPLDWARPQRVEFDVSLTVYNFTLPAIPTLESNFGASDPSTWLLDAYQEHRMMRWSFAHFPAFTVAGDGSIASIDYAALRQEVEAIHAYGTRTIGIHHSRPRANGTAPFQVNGQWFNRTNFTAAPCYEATIRAYFAQLEAYLRAQTYVDDFGDARSWFEEFYYNGEDEIQARAPEVRAEALAEYEWLKTVVDMPFPIMQTMMGAHPWPEIQAHIDIICIHTEGLEYDWLTEWKAQGKEIWMYTTRGPRFPSPSIATSGMAMQVRAIGWQCFLYNYTHYLIWDVATPYHARGGYGYQGWNGGTLLYPKPDAGSGDYHLSTRIELIRDGFEDHDYFESLRRVVAQRRAANASDPAIAEGEALLARVHGLMTFYAPDMDYRAYNALRHAIGTYLGTYPPF